MYSNQRSRLTDLRSGKDLILFLSLSFHDRHRAGVLQKPVDFFLFGTLEPYHVHVLRLTFYQNDQTNSNSL